MNYEAKKHPRSSWKSDKIQKSGFSTSETQREITTWYKTLTVLIYSQIFQIDFIVRDIKIWPFVQA